MFTCVANTRNMSKKEKKAEQEIVTASKFLQSVPPVSLQPFAIWKFIYLLIYL